MDDKPKEVPISRIVIEFQAPGNVNMSLDFQNVIPLQAVAAAWYLEKQAEVGFFQQEAMKQQQAEANKIAVPTLGVRKVKP